MEEDTTSSPGSSFFKKIYNYDLSPHHELIDALSVFANRAEMNCLNTDWAKERGFYEDLIAELAADQNIVPSLLSLPRAVKNNAPKGFKIEEMIIERKIIAAADEIKEELIYKDCLELARIPGIGRYSAGKEWIEGRKTFVEFAAHLKREGHTPTEREKGQLAWIKNPTLKSFSVKRASELLSELKYDLVNGNLGVDGVDLRLGGSFSRGRQASHDLDVGLVKKNWSDEDVEKLKVGLKGGMRYGTIYDHIKPEPIKFGTAPTRCPEIYQGAHFLKLEMIYKKERHLVEFTLINLESEAVTMMYLHSSANYGNTIYRSALSQGWVVLPTGVYKKDVFESGHCTTKDVVKVFGGELELLEYLRIPYEDPANRCANGTKDGLTWAGGKKEKKEVEKAEENVIPKKRKGKSISGGSTKKSKSGGSGRGGKAGMAKMRGGEMKGKGKGKRNYSDDSDNSRLINDYEAVGRRGKKKKPVPEENEDDEDEYLPQGLMIASTSKSSRSKASTSKSSRSKASTSKSSRSKAAPSKPPTTKPARQEEVSESAASPTQDSLLQARDTGGERHSTRKRAPRKDLGDFEME